MLEKGMKVKIANNKKHKRSVYNVEIIAFFLLALKQTLPVGKKPSWSTDDENLVCCYCQSHIKNGIIPGKASVKQERKRVGEYKVLH